MISPSAVNTLVTTGSTQSRREGAPAAGCGDVSGTSWDSWLRPRPSISHSTALRDTHVGDCNTALTEDFQMAFKCLCSYK